MKRARTIDSAAAILAVLSFAPLLAGGTVTKLLHPSPNGCELWDATMSADGSTIAFIDCQPAFYPPTSPHLYRVRTDGTGYEWLATMPAGGPIRWLAASADGSKYAFVHGTTYFGQWMTSDAWFVDAATKTKVALTADGSSGHVVEPVDISGDGKTVLFARYHADPSKHGTFLIHSDGTGETRVFAEPGACSISGDGKTVAVAARFGAQVKLFVMQSDGTGIREVDTPYARENNPVLDRTGDRVVFFADDDVGPPPKLLIAALDSEPIAVSSVKGDCPAGGISGDGQWLAFGSIPVGYGSWDLWRADASGAQAQYLAPCGISGQTRLISEDGSRLAFACQFLDGDPAGLYIADWNLPNLKACAVPLLGKPLCIALNGGPLDPFVLFLSLAPASHALPPYGVFGLDAATLIPLLTSALNPAGTLAIEATLPLAPQLAGIHIYVQAATGPPPLAANARLTNTLDLWMQP